MAFPADPLDVTAQLLVSSWTDITSDVFGGDRSQVVIGRGRMAEGSRAAPTRCDLSIRNTTGTYSPRNPASAYYGLLGRNTPLRVFTGTEHAGSAGGSATASTSHVAPSVTATGSGLLICGWIADDPLNYTLPGGMTAGPAETDGTYSTMRTAYQAVSAGATGTRTATASASHGYVSVSAVLHGTSVAVQETLSGTNDTLENITLTTSASTQAGWWLVAVQCWVRGSDVPMPDAPYGDDGGWIMLADSDVIEGLFAGSLTTYLHARVWARRVNTDGAQAVIFAGEAEPGAADNHAALYVLSGVDDWNIRATVEVPAWPSQWDVTGADVWVPITGQGILRRLEQGSSPLLSPLRRALTGAGATIQVGRNLLPVTYWPLEDASGSTQAAPGLSGGSPMNTSGTVQWASVSTPGSSPLPDWSASSGILYGPVKGVASGDNWSVGSVVQLTGSTSWTAYSVTVRGGPYDEVKLVLTSSAVEVTGTVSGTPSTILSSSTAINDGLPHWVEIRVTDAGSGLVNHLLYVDGTQVATTGASGSPGVPVDVRVLARSADTAGLGHIAVWANPVSSTYALILEHAVSGHAGETAGRRFERLCHEEGIAAHIVGDPDDTVAMGAQPTGSLVDLLRECEDADGGVLYEPREALGLAYRTVRSRYNQPVTLALTYGADGEVAPPMEPTDDDRGTRNDVTASRSGGSSARVEVTSGPLSTLEPPDGVGRYNHAVTVNVDTDGQLPNQAGWRAHLGTWDEPRFPVVRVNLGSLGRAGKSALMADAAAVDVGDRLTIDDPPVWLPPGPIDQHAEGYTETLNTFVWDLRLVCVPAGPYTIAEVDGEPRVAAEGSTLALAVGASDTTLFVASTAQNGPWTQNASDVPLDIRVGGERVTVSAITYEVNDGFDRTETDSWGSGYDLFNAVASAFQVPGTGVGEISPSLSTDVVAARAVGGPEQDVRVRVIGPGTPTGGSITQGLVARMVDASNFYRAVLTVTTGGVVSAQLWKRVSGLTSLGSTSTSLSAGSSIWVRVQCDGDQIRMKAWQNGTTEPSGWTLTATDTSLDGGYAGVLARRESGNTSPTTLQFDNFIIYSPQRLTVSARAVNGVTRAWPAGTEVDVWEPAVVAL